LKPGLGSLKVIRTYTDRSATYDFLLTFHSNHGPISYCFEINGDFGRNSQNFPTPHIFCTPDEGVPLGIDYQCSGYKLEWWGYRAEKKWQYLEPCGYNAPMWQTDRRTDTGQQQRPCLRIASCSKKLVHLGSKWYVLCVLIGKQGTNCITFFIVVDIKCWKEHQSIHSVIMAAAKSAVLQIDHSWCN